MVMSWPEESQFAPEPAPRGAFRARAAGLGGFALIAGGAIAIGVAMLAQQHAPQPTSAAAGAIGPAAKGPSLTVRSRYRSTYRRSACTQSSCASA